MTLRNKIYADIHAQEGLSSCINCGTCTAICAAAQFYDYDPRQICEIVQNGSDQDIETLLKSDTIWYCGECMSCKTRCPRGNAPGLLIMALRALSQDLGYFVESEKGRQQLVLKRTIGESILNSGYCVHIDNLTLALHPEQGPVWEWLQNNREAVLARVGANYKGKGVGALRQIPQESLDELKAIFDLTGATARYQAIEDFSRQKAAEMGLQFNDTGIDNQYVEHIFTHNSNTHSR